MITERMTLLERDQQNGKIQEPKDGRKPKNRAAESQRTKGMAESQGRSQSQRGQQNGKVQEGMAESKRTERCRSEREASRLAEATIGNEQAEWVI